MLYRLKQFFNALFPVIKNNEYSWLKEIMSEKQLALFLKQSPAEQRHALDVAYDIVKQEKDLVNSIGSESYKNLLLAALLHDCGKSLIKLRLWQRTFIVCYGFLPYRIRSNIKSKKNIFGKTIKIHHKHSAWGKHLAAKAGANSKVQKIIENHHYPTNMLERIICHLDNKH